MFSNFEECLHFINKTGDTKTFFVGANTCEVELLPKISELKNICAIYLYCPDKEQHGKLLAQCPKVNLLILLGLFLPLLIDKTSTYGTSIIIR